MVLYTDPPRMPERQENGSADSVAAAVLGPSSPRPARTLNGQRLILKEDRVIITAGDAAAIGRRAG